MLSGFSICNNQMFNTAEMQGMDLLFRCGGQPFQHIKGDGAKRGIL